MVNEPTTPRSASRRGSTSARSVHRDSVSSENLKLRSFLPPSTTSTTVAALAPALRYSSMFIFPANWGPRVLIYQVVKHKIFESVTIAIIVANCVTLALDDPTTDETPYPMQVLEYVFTSLFSLEMVLKVFALGFAFHPHAYLRSGWNSLDFIIVCLSYLSLLPGFGNYTAIRTLRVLRPLRSMNAVPGLRMIVNGLFLSVKGLVHVMLLALFIFLVYGIIGVQLWMGLFVNRCYEPETDIMHQDLFCKNGSTVNGYFGRNCPENMVCIQTENPNYGYTSFDHLGWAFLIIFQCITMEGWTDIMYMTFGVWGVLGAVYFIFLVIIGSFFVLNLALAVINDEFNEARDTLLQTQVLSAEIQKEERERVEMRKEVEMEMWAAAKHGGRKDSIFNTPTSQTLTVPGQSRPPDLTASMESKNKYVVPDNIPPITVPIPDTAEVSGEYPPIEGEHKQLNALEKLRLRVRFFVEGDVADEDSATLFQKVIIFFIVVNTAMMAAEYHGRPVWVDQIFDIANVILTSIFAAEMAIKIFALGFAGYARDRFNLLDGSIVIVSLIELSLSGSSTVSVFRALRLLRVFKLLKSFPSIRQLIEVIISAVAETGYLQIIIVLYLFIASLVGMSFFGGKFRPLEEIDGQPIRSTFDSFFWSLLTVFQIMTRDDWVNVMWNAMRSTNEWACLYFIALVLIGDFLILNLFLAILIQAFGEHATAEEVELGNVVLDDRVLYDRRMPRFDFIVPKFLLYRPKPQELTDLLEETRTSQAIPRRTSNKYKAASEMPYSVALGAANLHFDIPSLIPVQHSDLLLHAEKIQKLRHRKRPKPVSFATFDQQRTLTPRGTKDNRKKSSDMTTVSHMDADMVDSDHSSNSTNDLDLFPDTTICPICGESTTPALPIPPGVQMNEKVVHDRVCHHILLRKQRETALDMIESYIFDQSSTKPRKCTRSAMEEMLGIGWEVGLFLTFTVDNMLAQGHNWELLLYEISDTRRFLTLRPGEEALGHATVMYTNRSVPKIKPTNGGYSLFIFGPKNPFRMLLWRIVTNSTFEKVILASIILSSALLALDDPRDAPDSTMNKVINSCNTVFTSIFLAEMVMKIIATGLIFHPGAYLRDAWNIMDCILVCLSLVAEVMEDGSGQLSTLKVFRSFRTLRPLRVVNRNRGLKMVVKTLIASIKGISNVALISVLVFLVFAILGVQLLNGDMYYCTDTTINLRTDCTGLFLGTSPDSAQTRPIVLERLWLPTPRNFDNVAQGMLTLFELATLEWWNSIMYSSIDAVDFDHGPIRNHNPLIGLYYVVFVIVGAFFLLNLFVGVVIYNFNSVKNQMDGLSLLTDQQRLWVETQRMMLNFRPTIKLKARSSKLEKFCFLAVQNKQFEIFIGSIICLNVIVLAVDHNDSSDTFNLITGVINDVFSYIFIAECGMKLVAYNYKYFWEGWHRFDFFLVLLSITQMLLDAFSDSGLPISPGVLRVFRVFRVMRILRLVRQARKVRVLLETLWYSLPSLGNIGAFLFLLFFMFAVLGVNLFGLVRRGQFLTDLANFDNFPQAFLTLVRCTTGENWNGLMHDSMVSPPDCPAEIDPNTGIEYDTCGSPIAPVYYISFIIISAFVLTNLFIAIILDNFDTTMKIEKSKIKMHDLHRFVERWRDYDENATLVIPTHRLPDLMAHLPPPLGLARAMTRQDILRETRKLAIPEHGGVIHFVETLIPIARAVLGVDLHSHSIREHEDMWKVSFPDILKLPVLRFRQVRITVEQYFSSTYIQAAYKRKHQAEHARKLRIEKMRDIEEQFSNLSNKSSPVTLGGTLFTAQSSHDTPAVPKYIERHQRLLDHRSLERHGGTRCLGRPDNTTLIRRARAKTRFLSQDASPPGSPRVGGPQIFQRSNQSLLGLMSHPSEATSQPSDGDLKAFSVTLSNQPDNNTANSKEVSKVSANAVSHVEMDESHARLEILAVEQLDWNELMAWKAVPPTKEEEMRNSLAGAYDERIKELQA